MKHRIKLWLREAWARLLFHSGLWRLVDRLMPRRWTILAGHCVAEPTRTDGLPRDMRIRAAKLERFLAHLGGAYELVPVEEGLERVAGAGRKSLVSLSMDDGYLDNVETLLPLCSARGVRGTVYLETGVLDDRRPNWTHRLFWLLDRLGPQDFARRFVRLSDDARTNAELETLLAEERATLYQVKRVLKYEVPAAARERALGALFAELGGDERALADALYMRWEGARALAEAGFELGGHTVRHVILSKLDDAAVREEVGGCRAALARELGRAGGSFAYPFGRRWDFDERAVAAAREAGFSCAVTTHAGTNHARSDRWRLKRLMIDEDSKLHLVAAEACGGFDLLRRVGLDLSE